MINTRRVQIAKPQARQHQFQARILMVRDGVRPTSSVMFGFIGGET